MQRVNSIMLRYRRLPRETVCKIHWCGHHVNNFCWCINCSVKSMCQKWKIFPRLRFACCCQSLLILPCSCMRDVTYKTAMVFVRRSKTKSNSNIYFLKLSKAGFWEVFFCLLCIFIVKCCLYSCWWVISCYQHKQIIMCCSAINQFHSLKLWERLSFTHWGVDLFHMLHFCFLCADDEGINVEVPTWSSQAAEDCCDLYVCKCSSVLWVDFELKDFSVC